MFPLITQDYDLHATEPRTKEASKLTAETRAQAGSQILPVHDVTAWSDYDPQCHMAQHHELILISRELLIRKALLTDRASQQGCT